MKNKKSLLLDVIKIGLLCIVAGSVCAMDLAMYARKKESSIEGLFEKLHLLSMEKMVGCQHFSEDQRQDIRNSLYVNKKHSTLFLFDVATLLLPELREKVALCLLNNNKDQAHNFLKEPIYKSLNRYQASSDVMDGELFIIFSGAASPTPDKLPESCGIDTIFELLDDIAIVDKLLHDKGHVCNIKELVSFSKVLQSFPLIEARNKDLLLRYLSRDAYTISNIIKEIDELQCFGLVLLGIPLVSAFIGQKLCTKVVVPHLVELNRRTMIKNEGILKELQARGEQLLPKDIIKMVDPLKHSWLNYAKIIAPYGAIGPSVILIMDLFIRNTKSVKDVIIRLLKATKNNRLVTAVAIASGLVPFLVFQALFYAASSCDLTALESLLDNRLAVHGGLLGLYMLGCLLYNVKCMSARQVRVVRLENIPRVLDNKNIVIM